jgi:hypothetical protein
MLGASPAVGVSIAAEVDDPANRAFLFNEVGEFEEAPNFPLGFVPNHQMQSQALANELGRVTVLTLAHFKLSVQLSTDGGATFGIPITVESARPVLSFVAYRSEDERIYLVYRYAGLTRDVGLRFRRSDDLGQTWTNPVDLVQEGDAHHGVNALWGVHANEIGRVVVAFSEYWETNDTFAMVSSNYGSTWTTPIKPDLDTVANRVPLECDAVVDQSGTVHVAYVQNRGSGQRVFYSRSTDGGVSFSGEQSLGQSVSGPGTQSGLDIDITRQGRVVIAAGDTPAGGTLRVWHSANAGLSFSQTANWGNTGAPSFRAARVFPSYATDTVIVGYLNDSGGLYTLRSADQGASFGSPIIRSVGPVRDYAFGRTTDGRWVMVQEREPATADPRFNTLQAASSSDDGVTYGPFDQVDHAGGVDQGESRLANLQTTNGLAGVFVLYREFRNGSSYETFGNRATTASFDFNDEKQLGSYSDVDNHVQYGNPLIVATTANDLHLLYRMITQGGLPDVYYARSINGGDTYQAPFRLSQHAAGTQDILQVGLAAHPTDPLRLYIAYARQHYGLATIQLVFRKSIDGGTNWTPEQVLDTPSGMQSLRLSVNPNDDAFIVYSLGTDVRMLISHDDATTWGASFDFDLQNTGQTVINDQPVICSSGNLTAVVWRSNQIGGSFQTIYARNSTDGGVTFNATVNLRAGQLTSANVPDVECSGSDAFAVWADFRDSALTRAWGNRFTALAWQTERQVAPGQARNQFVPRVIYTLNGVTPHPIVIYTDNTQVFTNRSLDGGATWQAATRIDDLAPQPLANSFRPYLTSDGTGNTWAVWQDSSAGLSTIAARHSSNGGSSWDGLVVRLNSEPNQGSKFNAWNAQVELPVGAKGGTMHAVFTGYRASSYWDTRVARWRFNDSDLDGVPAGVDCNDADPNIRAMPSEIAGVLLTKVGGAARIDWTSQDAVAGSSTSYDIVTGDLAALSGAGGYGAATCLVNNDADTPFDDLRPQPAAGVGVYYLVRGQHSCTGTFGNSREDPDPRDALDTSTPCP